MFRPRSPRAATLRPTLRHATAVLAGLWIAGILAAVPAAACPSCHCYFSSDCRNTNRGKYCKYVGDCMGGSGCRCVNKPDTKINGVLICGQTPGQPRCDGLCVDSLKDSVQWSDVAADDVAQAVDLYLEAYITAGLLGGGDPERALLAQAQSVPLTPEWRAQVEDDVHQILVVLLGGDFLTPQADGVCAHSYGQVPALGTAAAELLDTVRDAVVRGIRENDIGTARPAIDSFWATRSYEPLHPHGCYPHGHADAPDIATCQGDQIEGLLEVLNASRQPVAVEPAFPGSDQLVERTGR